MKNRTVILSTALCLVPILLGLALYGQLPDMIPTHFNLNGTANGWSSKEMAVFGIPAFMAVLNLCCHLASNALGRGEKKVAPGPLFLFTAWLIPVLCNIMVPMSLFMGLGMEMPVGLIGCLLIGVVFVVVGNYLPKCKPNRYMGIKLPWTFASEENWWKTHRFSGKVWVACGFAMIVAGIMNWDWLLGLTVIAAISLPCGYSYLEYRKEFGLK